MKTYLFTRNIINFFGMMFIILCLTTEDSIAQHTKLHEFDGTISDGSKPIGDLVVVGEYLYGMTYNGGANNLGTIFKIKPDGTAYDILFDFNGINGSYPNGSLVAVGNNLYGMAHQGGDNDLGTIFQITINGSFTKMYDFEGGASSGANPLGSLYYHDNQLYGMTHKGGVNKIGTIFKVSISGEYTHLYNFSGDHTSGKWPNGSFISDGTFLYGMTPRGGEFDHGTYFKMSTSGAYTHLYSFRNSSTTGEQPCKALVFDGVYMYGMTSRGGANNFGTIFKIKPDGMDYSLIHSFDSHFEDGKLPNGSLFFTGTFLYGMAWVGTNGGVIFKIKPDGSEYTNMYTFAEQMNDGKHPRGSLISDGTYLYGMSTMGGANDLGTIFKYAYCISSNLTITSSAMYNETTWSTNVHPQIIIGTGTSITAETNQEFKFSSGATVNGPFSSGTGGNTLSIVPTPCK